MRQTCCRARPTKPPTVREKNVRHHNSPAEHPASHWPHGLRLVLPGRRRRRRRAPADGPTQPPRGQRRQLPALSFSQRGRKGRGLSGRPVALVGEQDRYPGHPHRHQLGRSPADDRRRSRRPDRHDLPHPPAGAALRVLSALRRSSSRHLHPHHNRRNQRREHPQGLPDRRAVG